MRASLLTRAASLAAAAVIATTGAMAVAGAADASVHYRHRLPTHVSASKSAVSGSTDTMLNGRLTTGFPHLRNIPLGGRVVFLEALRWRHGKIFLVKVAREVTSTTKGSVGDVSMSVDPAKTVHYVWVFEGTHRLHSSHSRILTVKG
jgi:dihydroorotase-like cyclic amidohydrolase